MRTLTLSLPLLLLLGCGGSRPAGDLGPRGEGGDALGAGKKDGDKWTVQFTEKLGADGLVASVATTASCCDSKDSEAEGSPARLYLAPSGGGAGYLLFLGKDDTVVLAAQTGPGAYDLELYRSTNPATRTEDQVTLTVPGDKLPGGDLRIWAGTRSATAVLGKNLDLKLGDGSIPCAMLETDMEAEPVAVVGGDTPPPEGQDPQSGDPDKSDTDTEPPPAGQDPKTGDPEKDPSGADTPPPAGQDPKTGDPKAAVPPQGVGARETDSTIDLGEGDTVKADPTPNEGDASE